MVKLTINLPIRKAVRFKDHLYKEHRKLTYGKIKIIGKR